jgi:hypothetical protein
MNGSPSPRLLHLRDPLPEAWRRWRLDNNVGTTFFNLMTSLLTESHCASGIYPRHETEWTAAPMACELAPTRADIGALEPLRNDHAAELADHDLRFGFALAATYVRLQDGPEAWFRAAVEHPGIRILDEPDLRPIYDRMSELTAISERQRG